ncbi:MAG: hypothetical protein IJZ01_04980 [Paraprevotella sp.]|nr:hypothetical protein [Paraprevotella sp.]
MQFLLFLKKMFVLILLLAGLALLFLFHLNFSNTKEKIGEKDIAGYVEVFTSGYKVYYLTSISESIDKTMACAEDLYRKEFEAGKTEDEFTGLTVLDYCNKVLNNPDYEDRLTKQDHMSLFLPILFVILLIIAIVKSISVGLGSIRRLDFNNEATTFDN